MCVCGMSLSSPLRPTASSMPRLSQVQQALPAPPERLSVTRAARVLSREVISTAGRTVAAGRGGGRAAVLAIAP